ncbi:tigger transposable element-derived protein 4-like [Dermacentor andersoni]|uniref:tigger transposable element-derived protein 4-like n=1 Tax=Dermacentor andersoni TaxID=34620 RepID=UPI0024162EB4|nr:tigger transposable element-derived protein 4-like [Dermacentor andersoni]
MAPTKRRAVSLDTKMDILQDSRRGFKVSALVKKYELAQLTISTILKTGSTTIVKAGAIGSHADQRKRVRDPLYTDVEEALYQWFITTRAHNVPISGPILATKAKNFAFLLGRPNFVPGGGWIQHFKERHGIVYKNVVGEAASLDTEAKQQWLQTKLPSVLERYAEDTYNCDETALFFQMLPSKTHALKGDRCPGGKHSKLRVTVLLCVSMDGSHRLNADSAASFCDEVTDEAIAEDVLSRQTAKLCDGGDGSSDSDNEIGSGSLTPTTLSTQSALSSINSLIDFMHAKGLPPVFAQQLESMHTAVVKLKLPQKQVQISDYFGAPNP